MNSDGDYNVFIGECAGCCTNSNTNRDVVIGYTAGKYLYGVQDSVIIGACAAGSASADSSGSSVFIGKYAKAGYDAAMNSTWNIAIGTCAAYSQGVNTCYNVAVGYEAGKYTYCASDYNISIGAKAGYCQSGQTGHNITIGNCAGYCGSGVGENIFIGCKSGYYTCCSTSGACRNIFMGPSSGCNLACGKNNIFFGAYTGLVAGLQMDLVILLLDLEYNYHLLLPITN